MHKTAGQVLSGCNLRRWAAEPGRHGSRSRGSGQARCIPALRAGTPGPGAQPASPGHREARGTRCSRELAGWQCAYPGIPLTPLPAAPAPREDRARLGPAELGAARRHFTVPLSPERWGAARYRRVWRQRSRRYRPERRTPPAMPRPPRQPIRSTARRLPSVFFFLLLFFFSLFLSLSLSPSAPFLSHPI